MAKFDEKSHFLWGTAAGNAQKCLRKWRENARKLSRARWVFQKVTASVSLVKRRVRQNEIGVFSSTFFSTALVVSCSVSAIMGMVISGFSFIISMIFTELFCEPLKASKIRLIFLEYHLQYRLEYHQSDEKCIRTTILHNIFRTPDLQSAFLDFRKNLKKKLELFLIFYTFCIIFAKYFANLQQ